MRLVSVRLTVMLVHFQGKKWHLSHGHVQMGSIQRGGHEMMGLIVGYRSHVAEGSAGFETLRDLAEVQRLQA
jgi:hypothetical protein